MVDVHRHVAFVGGIYMETNGTCGDFNRVSSFFSRDSLTSPLLYCFVYCKSESLKNVEVSNVSLMFPLFFIPMSCNSGPRISYS